MTEIELYRSVLVKLGAVSAENLAAVDAFLTKLAAPKTDKAGQHQKLALTLAGAWKDWDEAQFGLFLQHTATARLSLFAERTFEA